MGNEKLYAEDLHSIESFRYDPKCHENEIL